MGSLDKELVMMKPKQITEDGCYYDISLKVPMEMGFIDNVKINFIDDEFKSFDLNFVTKEDEVAIFSSEIFLPTRAIYHYYFSFTGNSIPYYLGSSGFSRDAVSFNDMFKMSVNFSVPLWAKGEIMYHIFVDRFKRNGDDLEKLPGRIIHESFDEDMIIGPSKDGKWNTDFYGGNLKGIIEKLDYIKSLGVSILYLSPIVLSSSNHRYDTSDYEEIDPYVGSLSDLKKLCDKAHEKGMRVILDAVFNHTGNDSKYFNEYGNFGGLGAYQSDNSPYSDFYRKKDGKFDYWWGMKNLPVCDGYSRHWQDYIYGEGGIIDRWFSLGIDGLRLDVADELTDEFIEGIRRAVKRNKEDGFILGEVWKNPMRMNRGYISSGKGMDSVMDYVLVDALIRYLKDGNKEILKDVIRQLKSEYPVDTMLSLMNFTSTHDISRAINIFGSDRFRKDGEWAWSLYDEDYRKSKDFVLSDLEYEKGKDLLETYLFALTFLPGNLSIFYGDEVGLQGEGNLANRKPFPWNNMDKDLLEFFREIGKIRKSLEFLKEADLDITLISDSILSFERISPCDESITFINRTSDYKEIEVPYEFESGKVYSLRKSTSKVLRPYGGVSLVRKR